MNTIKHKIDQKRNPARHIASNKRSSEGECEELKRKIFNDKANQAKKFLLNVFTKIDVLNNDNFDVLFPELLSNMKEAAILRNELIAEVGAEKLMEKRPELFSTAKQIEIKYDSTVKKFLEEERRLERELNTLNQMKKLTAYQR